MHSIDQAFDVSHNTRYNSARFGHDAYDNGTLHHEFRDGETFMHSQNSDTMIFV